MVRMMGAFGPGELTIVMRVDSAAAAAGAKQAADSVNAAVRSTAEVSTESTGKINQNILSNRENDASPFRRVGGSSSSCRDRCDW